MKIPIVLLTGVWAVIATIGLSGCSSKPTAELKMVGAAMEQARKVEASEYDPIDWDRARWQWEEANALIRMGRYDEANGVLVDAVASYNTAREEATRRIEGLKIELAALQTSAESELKRLEQDGERATLNPSARKRVEAALPRIDELVSKMNADVDAKEYLRARMSGHEAMRYIVDLRRRLGMKP